MSDGLFIIGGAFLLIASALGAKESREKIINFFKGTTSNNTTVNDVDYLFGGEGNDIIGGQGNDTILGYAPSTTYKSASRIKSDALNEAKELIKKREGVRDVVYLDSLGKATVGVGHLVLPQDNLKVGDRIPMSRVYSFFNSDIQKAFNSAYSQATELGLENNVEMIATLTSVNFQLGTGWTREFNNTWAKLKRGDAQGAVNNILSSLWHRQTPTRTADLINTIKRVYS